jgi:tetratricopeptide (TPR) repeat protein
VYKIVLFFFVSIVLFAQSSATLKGELHRRGEFPMVGYSIELTNAGNRSANYQATVSSTGEFAIDSVPLGTYQVRVLKDNRLVHQAYVTTNGSASLVQLDLPESEASARPASGTVSLHRLSHKPLKKAVKEMKQAAKAREKGDVQKSLRHLEKAVEIDPEYVEAQVNLGARYMEVKRIDDAATAFERAIQIDPYCTQAHSNLALVMLHRSKPKEAEIAARRAIDIDDGNIRAHYVLGFALSVQDPSSEEALKHFIRASDGYPMARVGAAQILLKRGDKGLAERQLKAYLSSGDKTQKEVVQSYLSQLRE